MDFFKIGSCQTSKAQKAEPIVQHLDEFSTDMDNMDDIENVLDGTAEKSLLSSPVRTTPVKRRKFHSERRKGSDMTLIHFEIIKSIAGFFSSEGIDIILFPC